MPTLETALDGINNQLKHFEIEVSNIGQQSTMTWKMEVTKQAHSFRK
jgi:hypothetical protein